MVTHTRPHQSLARSQSHMIGPHRYSLHQSSSQRHTMVDLKGRPALTLVMLEYLVFGVFLTTGARCEVREVFAEASSQTVLPCYGNTPSSSPPTIIWKRADQRTVWKKLKNGLQYWGGARSSTKETQRIHGPHSWFEQGNYSLQINNVKEEDGGRYTCRVEDGGGVTTNVIMLRVIKVSISPSVTISGQNVLISCKVTPGLLGAALTWRLNNSTLVPPPAVNSTTDATVSVVSDKLTARLTGQWTCVVAHKGKEERASAVLTLKGIIRPPTDGTRIYAAVGSAPTLPCVFSPVLSPSNPVWEKLEPGSLFKPASFPPSSSSSSSSADYSVVLEEAGSEAAGVYRCSATVEGTLLTRNVQLVFARIDRSVSSNPNGSVTLTCGLTDTSGVTRYEWVHANRSVGFTRTGKTLRIDMTSEETQGEWACRFYGKEGILGNVSTHIQLLADPSGQRPSGLSRDGGAVIGVSCVALVLLLLLVKVYQNHRRRKRILRYPGLEAVINTVFKKQEETEMK